MRTQHGHWSILALAVGILALGCTRGAVAEERPVEQADHDHEETEADETLGGALTSAGVFITHIHGIGYSSDGRRLLVAAHDGLKELDSGRWRDAGAPHDFMEFTAVEGGFFSSGHPTPVSDLPNPFGLIFVQESDWSISFLGFQGDLDFHSMAAGYFSKAIYLVNPDARSDLGAGLSVSEDQGASWQQGIAAGLEGTLIQIAVHPSDPKVSAYATTDGLYRSLNGGNIIERVAERTNGYAVTFSPDGNRIYLGGAQLEYWDEGDRNRVLRFDVPEDTITHIAVSPADMDEIAVATNAMSIYISHDGGGTWDPMLIGGRTP